MPNTKIMTSFRFCLREGSKDHHQDQANARNSIPSTEHISNQYGPPVSRDGYPDPQGEPLSAKLNRQDRRKAATQAEKNRRRYKKARVPEHTYSKIRDSDLFDEVSTNEVKADLSTASSRTTRGFIGKPTMTHPSKDDLSGNTTTGPKVELHPECDVDVRKKYMDEGWIYIENDEGCGLAFVLDFSTLTVLRFETAWPK